MKTMILPQLLHHQHHSQQQSQQHHSQQQSQQPQPQLQPQEQEQHQASAPHPPGRSSQAVKSSKPNGVASNGTLGRHTGRSGRSRHRAAAAARNGTGGDDEAPFFTIVTTYITLLVLVIFGHIRDFFGKRFKKSEYSIFMEHDGYAPLTSDFDSFYTRRLKWRIQDCFSRPITGVPGRTVNVLERTSSDYNKTFRFTGKTLRLLNLSSYNYLGFARCDGPCADAVEATIRRYGISTVSPRLEVGTSEIHTELEAQVARFLGNEAALVISMGFATNSTIIPALVSKGCLVISDQLNHSSLVYGIRLSGASIKVFNHNDMQHLESILREAIAQGQPRTHQPWKKMLVIVEGLYSMEGSVCKLREIVALKEKYKFYLYVDEAHSIGALGPRGRGLCDMLGVDPSRVDILMGTFTKSFGALGGYIAGSRRVVDHLRRNAHCSAYAESMSLPIAQQVSSSMRVISGEDGTGEGDKRIRQLHFNARYFSQRLKEMGFLVFGDESSPVVPLMLYNTAKVPAFSRECLKRGIAVVVVGYPATPIISSRVRFCLSASHCKKDLDWVLSQIREIGDLLQIKYKRPLFGLPSFFPSEQRLPPAQPAPLPADPSEAEDMNDWWDGVEE